MKHKFQFSYKRQKLLTFTLVGSSLLVCLMSQAREFPSIKLPQKEYRLTGTSLQSVKEIVPYYDSCNTVYDDSLYQGEIVVTQEGTAGKQETTALITYLNGHAVSEEIIDSRVITPAIAREVHVGTKERPDFLIPVMITSSLLTSVRAGAERTTESTSRSMSARLSRAAPPEPSYNPVGTAATASVSMWTAAMAWSSVTDICLKLLSKSDRRSHKAICSDSPATPETAPDHICILKCG